MSQKISAAGLTEAQAAESRRAHGANVLEAPPHRSVWRLALEKLSEPLILILGVAALISVFTGGWLEGTGILLAIVLSAGIGFLSEYRAGREFDLLNRTDDDAPVKTRRDGRWVSRPKSALAVGDVIRLETGEETPADCRVLESSEFQVDASKFTGEPEPVPKVPANDEPAFAELAAGATYPPDWVLRGSNVLTGNAELRVEAVGMSTELGRTARAATEITDETTPLQKQLKKLGAVIAIVGAVLATFLFVTLLTRHWTDGSLTLPVALSIFMIAVTLIVVVVPEGLPMSVTLSLACNLRKMARSNCLLRKLHAGETIGCATVICTDKTGTLTMNQMRVVHRAFPDVPPQLEAEAIAANTTAELNDGEVLGNPTEGALLHALADAGCDYRTVRTANPVVKRWNFTTETKYMATELASGRIHLKGAPEVVIAKCALAPEKRAEILKAVQAEQSRGRRTLALAMAEHPEDPATAADLTYLGFVSIADPVRPEVPAAAEACRKAGIRIKIVTGDSPATAAEIARQIGLPSPEVIEGPDFAALDDAALRARVPGLSVIARARPDDKRRLVNTLRESGEVVAVTGDGTNDAPALHHADVGIAMGKTGTAIAREAADVILLDDSFGSIVNAVYWGRSLYLNIQRFLVFQLTVNAAAAVIALVGPFLGIEMPFTVVQMLWINLVMDTGAALALATEPPTPEVMERPPRRANAFIVTPAMAWAIAGTALLIVAMFLCGAGFWGRGPRELTMLFTGFVLFQVWNLWNVRALGASRSMLLSPPDNPVFVWVVAAIVGVQILITQFGGQWFRTVPLEMGDWLKLAVGSSAGFVFGELYRLRRRRAKRAE